MGHEKSTPTPLKYERKKNVQFKNLESDPGHSVNAGGKRVYDPILITPSHLYDTSLHNGPLNPDKDPSPAYHLDPRGRYFAGTVEDGRGGDFCGYYFAPVQSLTLNPPEKKKIHFTSTPRLVIRMIPQSLLDMKDIWNHAIYSQDLN